MVKSYTAGPPSQNACSASNPVIGDFNGNGLLDFAVNPCQGFQITLQDIGHFAPAGVAQTGSDTTRSIAGDLDGDGNLDLVFGRGDALVLLRGDGRGGFIPPTAAIPRLSLYAGASPNPVKVADLNGDGKPDLIALTDAGISGFIEQLDGAGSAIERRWRRKRGFREGWPSRGGKCGHDLRRESGGGNRFSRRAGLWIRDTGFY